jgi:hypothetical protein
MISIDTKMQKQKYRRIIEMKTKSVEIFTAAHFLLYYVIGLYVPGQYKLALAISLLWEMFEVFLTKNKTAYRWTKKYWVVEEKYWNESISNKVIDVCANMLGYHLGSLCVRESNRKN